MEKVVIFHNLADENMRPAMERWFRRAHVPDVLTQYPWMVRYLLYRPVPPPEGAWKEGLCTYRIHENWAYDHSFRPSGRGHIRMIPEPFTRPIVGGGAIPIPADPTEDFLGGNWSYEEHAFVRWILAYRYPEGVDPEECDRFFLEVQAPEIMKMPGLIRFFSHKAIKYTGSPLPIPLDDNIKEEDLDDEARARRKNRMRPWHRLSELWFECNDDWTNAVIKNPPHFTKPEWATSDTFPFLKPGANHELMHSFILETPDCDFTKTCQPLYF